MQGVNKRLRLLVTVRGIIVKICMLNRYFSKCFVNCLNLQIKNIEFNFYLNSNLDPQQLLLLQSS